MINNCSSGMSAMGRWVPNKTLESKYNFNFGCVGWDYVLPREPAGKGDNNPCCWKAVITVLHREFSLTRYWWMQNLILLGWIPFSWRLMANFPKLMQTSNLMRILLLRIVLSLNIEKVYYNYTQNCHYVLKRKTVRPSCKIHSFRLRLLILWDFAFDLFLLQTIEYR